RYHSRQAIVHLQECLRVWPDDPEVLVLAARCARRQGELDKAEAFLQRASRASAVAGTVALEPVLLRASRGEVAPVGAHCEVLLPRNDPAAPLVFEALVSGCWRLYRAAAAAAYLRRWRELQPDNLQALLLQGMFRQQLGSPSEAMEDYERVLKLDPEMDPARL